MKFPPNADYKDLDRDFELVFCSQGPTGKGWEGHYLQCSECNELVLKSGCHSCKCGNIYIDAEMFRIEIRDGDSGKIKTYFAYEK